MHAIAGVEAAGLQIYSVEITPAGAIRISTGARAEVGANEAKRQSSDKTPPRKNMRQA